MGPFASSTKWINIPFFPYTEELSGSKDSIILLWEPRRGYLLNQKWFLFLRKWREKHLWTDYCILFSPSLQRITLSSALNFITVFTECSTSHWKDIGVKCIIFKKYHFITWKPSMTGWQDGSVSTGTHWQGWQTTWVPPWDPHGRKNRLLWPPNTYHDILISPHISKK